MYTNVGATVPPAGEDASTTAEIAAGENQDYERLNTELNTIYKAILKEISESGLSAEDRSKARAQFIAAQRAWLRFRDADCAAIHLYVVKNGGSMFEVMNCMRKRTGERISTLKADFLGQSP